jgi:hypothetical protein
MRLLAHDVILLLLGDISFAQALRPPMEERGGADESALRLEGDTAGSLGVLQLLDGGEMPIHQHSIGERPQMFSGLEFGGIRRQKQQMEVVRHAEALGAVPACPIQYQHNLLLGSSPDLARKRRQFRLEKGNADRGRQVKDGATGGGVDKAHEVAPAARERVDAARRHTRRCAGWA